MTEPVASTERLTTLEARVAHIRELMDERDRGFTTRIAELISHNRLQDQEQEKLIERLSDKIEEIQAILWNALKWLGGLLATTLLSVALKTLGLI
jgi:F0F1-type ATP synthase delta subunit